ncbi:MAG: RluA family pseudouridine synthase [Acidaminococcaceae bacterium]|nr:RluA family pseudouridine synthase [Acidaminococcaceae bacterium]MDD4722872.1 RluA family pseudouridine synthase [Acidaminococcaceae bacterium]
METFVLAKNVAPIHLKQFLAGKGISGIIYRKLKLSGYLWVNNKVPIGNILLTPGSTITFDYTEEASTVTPENGTLKIIYEDEHLLIVNKAAGMLVHPTTKNMTGTLANLIAGYYKTSGIKAGMHPVSRLDKNTSGLVLFAKKGYIQFAFTLHPPHKEYLGLVDGIPAEPCGTISVPISRKPGSIIEREVNQSTGKYARTDYYIIKAYKNLALVRFVLHTGRTHQIRVHTAHLGYPLHDDNLYGKKGPQGRHCLHANRLRFEHPITHKNIDVSCVLPSDMLKIINLHKA